jgi:predicted polyphosphate/ATP-dependent NAD kinase
MMIGFIVNPIAGMGGRVGLKGTDGEDILKDALSRGAKPWAPQRAIQALSVLKRLSDDYNWVTWSGEMGEKELRAAGFMPKVIGYAEEERTSAEDTKRAAKKMQEIGVDLILFVGGDGTASDIVEAVDMLVPILGIPAGVKMFSGVFTSTPGTAAQVVRGFIEGEIPIIEKEVMDIDEDAYRAGRLSASLKGYAKTPYAAFLVQSEKSMMTAVDEELMKEAVAARVVEDMTPESMYILGPGTTVAKVAELLGVEKTLLGIDVVQNGGLILKDADEDSLLAIEENDTWFMLSPLGGQGSLLGRGNQPISPRVIKRVGFDRIIVIATLSKVQELRALTVDTGDPELDDRLRGYIRVIVGYHEEKVMRVI